MTLEEFLRGLERDFLELSKEEIEVILSRENATDIIKEKIDRLNNYIKKADLDYKETCEALGIDPLTGKVLPVEKD